MSRADGGKGRTAGDRLRSVARGFAGGERGATSIEYALIAGLIFVVVVGSLRVFASRAGNVYTQIGNAISQTN